MRGMPPQDKAVFNQRVERLQEVSGNLDKTLSPQQRALRDQMVSVGRQIFEDPNFSTLPAAYQKQLKEEGLRSSKAYHENLNPEQKGMMDEMRELRRSLPVPERATPLTPPPPYNSQVAKFISGLSPEQSQLMDRLQQSNVRALPEAERAFKDSLRPDQQQGFADFQREQLKRHGVRIEASPAPAPAPVPADTTAPAATPPAAPAAGPQTVAPTSVAPTISPAPAAVSMHPQQHQAYLKSLGYEVGSLNDTAKNKDQIEAATRKFAVDNKIDPSDKAAVNKALQQKAMEGAAAQIDKTQLSVTAGKYSPEDVKVSQWLMKGQGRDMPKSTRPDGTVDGIPGKETKTAMPETVIKLKADAAAPKIVTPPSISAPAAEEPQPNKVTKPQVPEPADNSEAIRKFEESLSPQQKEIYTRLKEDQKNYDGQRSINLSSGQPMGIMLFDRPDWRELTDGRSRFVIGLTNDNKGGIGLNDHQKELFKKAHPSYAEEAGRPEIKAEPRVPIERPTKFPTIDTEEIKRVISKPLNPRDIDWRISPQVEERLIGRNGGKIIDPSPFHELLNRPPASSDAPPIGRKDIQLDGVSLPGSVGAQQVKVSGFTKDEVRDSREAFLDTMSDDQRVGFTRAVSKAAKESNMFTASSNVDKAGAEFARNNLSPEQNKLFDEWKNKQGKQGGAPEYAAAQSPTSTAAVGGQEGPASQATDQSATLSDHVKALLGRPNAESMSNKAPSLATPGFNPDVPQPGTSVKLDAFKV